MSARVTRETTETITATADGPLTLDDLRTLADLARTARLPGAAPLSGHANAAGLVALSVTWADVVCGCGHPARDHNRAGQGAGCLACGCETEREAIGDA